MKQRPEVAAQTREGIEHFHPRELAPGCPAQGARALGTGGLEPGPRGRHSAQCSALSREEGGRFGGEWSSGLHTAPSKTPPELQVSNGKVSESHLQRRNMNFSREFLRLMKKEGRCNASYHPHRMTAGCGRAEGLVGFLIPCNH